MNTLLTTGRALFNENTLVDTAILHYCSSTVAGKAATRLEQSINLFTQPPRGDQAGSAHTAKGAGPNKLELQQLTLKNLMSVK